MNLKHFKLLAGKRLRSIKPREAHRTQIYIHRLHFVFSNNKASVSKNDLLFQACFYKKIHSANISLHLKYMTEIEVFGIQPIWGWILPFIHKLVSSLYTLQSPVFILCSPSKRTSIFKFRSPPRFSNHTSLQFQNRSNTFRLKLIILQPIIGINSPLNIFDLIITYNYVCLPSMWS